MSCRYVTERYRLICTVADRDSRVTTQFTTQSRPAVGRAFTDRLVRLLGLPQATDHDIFPRRNAAFVALRGPLKSSLHPAHTQTCPNLYGPCPSSSRPVRRGGGAIRPARLAPPANLIFDFSHVGISSKFRRAWSFPHRRLPSQFPILRLYKGHKFCILHVRILGCLCIPERISQKFFEGLATM